MKRSVLIKWFDSLDKRDFENGAVTDNIRQHLRDGERAEAERDRLREELAAIVDEILSIHKI